MPQANVTLKDPVTDLTGVGPKLAEKLDRLGLQSVGDLVFHLPYRFEDRTRLDPIGSAVAGKRLQICGKVAHAQVLGRRQRVLKAVVEDGTGSIALVLFRFYPNQRRMLQPGRTVLVYGEVSLGQHGLEMIHPHLSEIAENQKPELSDRLDPIYPTTSGLAPSAMARIVSQALEVSLKQIAELLPEGMLERHDFPPLVDGLRLLHRPPPSLDLEALETGSHPALQRLAFEELLAHHLAMRLLRQRIRSHRAPALGGDGKLRKQFLQLLPFSLTGAQQRSVLEIEHDLTKPTPALRLIQGDVGSGKTVVAAMAILQAIEAGAQVALMAPTELLARQHLETLSGWFDALDLQTLWLSSSVKLSARSQTLAKLAEGAPLIVGTHALFQEEVRYANLGLVVIDEQHRFGVHQRLALADQHESLRPHQLVLTATPIPRTLAMTAYADLDISVIDELPPGRTPVETVVVDSQRRDEVINRLGRAIADGRQAYWVCTLIEESEVLEANPATQAQKVLTERLPKARVGLVHGRLSQEQKEEVMAQFKAGEMDVLVATTVIEVGVDVPNASLMIIENAERLGLAQLHQLRGRVGRGEVASVCLLMYQKPLSAMARARLEVLRETADGFAIARRDLELRGPGEVLGTRQTGLLSFRTADIMRDAGLLPEVQALADELLDRDPSRAQQIVDRWLGSALRFVEA